MIQVTLKLLGPFRPLDAEPDSDGAQRCTMEAGERLSDAVQRAALPDDVPRVVLLNGVQHSDDPHMADGDIVTVFPPIAGGCQDELCMK